MLVIAILFVNEVSFSHRRYSHDHTFTQKLMQDLKLHGLSSRTQEMYVLTVQQLAEHYHKSPDQINEAELRSYFPYLLNEKQVAPRALPPLLENWSAKIDEIAS
jgi:hypothetical protein